MAAFSSPESGNENVFALPCLICGRPLYESNSGFRILKGIVNNESFSFPEVMGKVPPQWRKPVNLTRGDFALTVNSDYPIETDVPFLFIGEFVEHKKYGLQFSAFSYCADDPIDERMMIEYLCRLPNIEKARAKILVKTFGLTELSDVIEKTPMRLTEVRGITPPRADLIRKVWMKDRNVRRVFMWLLAHDVPAIFGRKIITHFGAQAIDVLESNPYALTELRGIGFIKADDIAHKVLKDIPRHLRAESCLRFLLHENEYSGHTCYPMILLREQANELLGKRAGEDYSSTIQEVIRDRFVMVGNRESQVPFIYLPSMFSNERYCASFLASFTDMESVLECSDNDLDEAEKECAGWAARFGQSREEFKLDDNQRAAVRSAFENKITVITGGGGTGKSTICRAICDICDERCYSVTLFAPTGQAAKVLGDKTDKGASTIHRGLGLVPGGRTGVKINPTAENVTVSSDILIIDEFSMVGTDILPFIFGSLTKPNVTNIVFVGDPQQLPSISPGNNLHDIIESGCASVIKLEAIYRQTENSHISTMADKIAHGQAVAPPKSSDDFFWIDCDDSEKALEHIEKIALECDDVHKLQALCSIYARACGVNAVNALFQRLFTEKSKETVCHEQRVFYKGDRVMQVVNNYDRNVFNGNLGYIVALGLDVLHPDSSDKEVKYIVVDMEKRGEVRYEGDEISELRVAWCSTVHKFQGSQMPEVVFLMMTDHRAMMSRELVYTAFTRAENALHVIGSRYMISRASSRSVIETRYTNMVDLYRRAIGEFDGLIFKFPDGFDPSQSPFHSAISDDEDDDEDESNETKRDDPESAESPEELEEPEERPVLFRSEEEESRIVKSLTID